MTWISVNSSRASGRSISVAEIYAGRVKDSVPPVTEATPQFRDIHISNVVCDGAEEGIFVRGLPEMNIRDVYLDDMVLKAAKGAELMAASRGKDPGIKLIYMTPVNTAICSFGMSGRVFHAPFLHVSPQFQFYSVWEREKNLASKIYPGVRVCRTLEELLADEAVELVIVNTPNYTHFDYTRQALQAGKHVIVEKPFTVTEAEGLELIALAKKMGKKLTSFQSRRFDSDYRTVKRIVDSGVLGKIVEAELHYDRYTPALSPKVHKETPGPGRGLLYDLGSHLIDQVLQLFGDPDFVFADIFIIRDNSQVDDYMELLLYYPGMRARIKSSYLVREPIPSYDINGHLGTFLKSRTDVQERHLLAGEMPGGPDWGVEPEAERGLLHTEIDGKVIREYVPTERGNYMDFFTGVYEAIRHDRPLPVTAEQAVRIIRVIEKAYESVREKKIVLFR